MSSRIPDTLSGINPGAASAASSRIVPARRVGAVSRVEGQRQPPAAMLAGSGIDLLDLLLDGDHLVERTPATATQLRQQLEAARGAMVRNQPVVALAMLDDVWESASRFEEGWYLRGSALAVMGLPGEAARVTAEGIALRPHSVALPFLYALTSLALGDTTSAKRAVDQALAVRPDDPLLRAQASVILARQGDFAGALRSLSQLAMEFPGHPATAVARAWIDNVSRQGRRDGAVPGFVSTPTVNTSIDVDPATNSPDDAPFDDVLDSLVRSLARRIVSPSSDDERRTHLSRVIASLSAGGALAACAPADRLHAARTFLTMVLRAFEEAPALDNLDDVTMPSGSSGTPTSNVAQGAMRHDKAERAVRMLMQSRDLPAREYHALLQRAALIMPPQVRRFFQVFADALVAPEKAGARGTPSSTMPRIETPSANLAVQGASGAAAERELLAPVRLGFALLEPTVVSQGTAASATVQTAVLQHHVALTDTAGERIAGRRSVYSASSGGARLLAVVFVVAATIAMGMGYPVVAIAFAGGASWIALRRGTRVQDTAEYVTVGTHREVDNRG